MVSSFNTFFSFLAADMVSIIPGKDFTKTTHHDTYPEINPATESDHTDHYIFITGASKGVGLASAISYAKAGAKGIALGARSDLETAKQEVLAAAKSAGKAAPQILTFKLDVTKWEEVSQAALETENEFGRLDILLNNAGYLSEFTPIVDSDPEEWWSNYEVNLKGVYLPTKAFLPLMLKGGEKTIVNVGSTGAHALTPGGSGYQNTKFALLRFTEYIMVEYGERGILAYCINPGAILTLLASKTPIEYRYSESLVLVY